MVDVQTSLAIAAAPPDFFEWGFKTIVTIGAAASGWFFNNLFHEMREMRKEHKQTSDELKDFKIHVSDNYPKETTMSRIHGRLDEMARDINDIKVNMAKTK